MSGWNYTAGDPPAPAPAIARFDVLISFWDHNLNMNAAGVDMKTGSTQLGPTYRIPMTLNNGFVWQVTSTGLSIPIPDGAVNNTIYFEWEAVATGTTTPLFYASATAGLTANPAGQPAAQIVFPPVL